MISGCSGAKYLNQGESILVGQSVDGVGPKMRDHIGTLYESTPNRRLVLPSGPSHLVYIYEFGKKRLDTAKQLAKREAINEKFDKKLARSKKPKRSKSLLEKKQQKISKVDRVLKDGNQLMRWGEPLATYNQAATDLTQEKIGKYLNSYGLYQNRVDVIRKYNGKDSSKVKVQYKVEKGPTYMIDSVTMVSADPIVSNLMRSYEVESRIKVNKPIRQLDLVAERDRIYQLMVNNGYFEFSKDQVTFQIDSSSLGPQKLHIRSIISNPPGELRHKEYMIDSVIFVTDSGLDIAKEFEDEQYGNVTYTFGRFRYSTKILNWHNYLYPGKIYSRESVLETQRHLSYMDNFKFINIKFDTLGSDFVAHIFTSPADRYQTSSEVGLSVTQGLPGPFANLNIKNRNLFHGLEITELNTNFKVEGLGGVSAQTNTYSSLQYGSELSITFPQFLSPLGRFYKKKIAKFNPRTRFGLAFGHEDRFDEYRRTTVNTSMGYIWKVKDHVSYTLSPMQMSYINSRTDSTFQAFLDDLELSGNTYANAFNSSFVGSGSFQLTINNNYGVSKNSSYQLFSIETGGHLFSLFGKKPFGNSLEYYQYTKTSIDLRNNFYITNSASLVTRLNIGVALPYGENSALPYEKYFFGGGSTSLRAWKPRRLGPGAYGERNASGATSYQREQPGDMIIEASAEIRQNLFGFVDYALFLDMGNVWLLKSQTLNPELDPEGDDGVFRFSNFAKELAIGSGVGLRFDLSFLVFRLDLGWKIVDPSQPLGKRWVAGQNEIINSSDKFPWFNLRPLRKGEINIGIGYPF